MSPRQGALSFHRSTLGRAEELALLAALRHGHLSGNGVVSARVQGRLQRRLRVSRAFLTPSGTAALELALLALGIGPGDEVILPSFTFVSDANAVLLRGAKAVFADVDPLTLNLDPCAVEQCLNRRTRAVILVHYAGIPCDMDAFIRLRRRHGVALIEDAALAFGSGWRGRPLGSLGDLGCFSFHATKQLTCGEGGALVTSDKALARRIERMQEKGTDRSAYLRGERDRYTWRSLGSSYLLADPLAAMLEAQLRRSVGIQRRLWGSWRSYQRGLWPLQEQGLIRLAEPPQHGSPNGHLFWFLLRGRWQGRRSQVLAALKASGVPATFHYIPLHSSPFGKRHNRAGRMPVTEDAGENLVRLPLHAGMTGADAKRVVLAVFSALQG